MNTNVTGGYLKIGLILFGLILMGGWQTAAAQFEGVITLKHIVANDQRVDGAFELIITTDRMAISGLESVGGYQAMGNMKSTRVLIRLDRRDFVFLSEENMAIKISKDQLMAMHAMMKSMQAYSGSAPKSDLPEYTFKKTGNNKKVKGYDAEEYIIDMQDQPGITYHAWITKDLNIKWGMLSESWGEGSASLFPENMPMNELLTEGGLPLLIERKKNGNLVDWVECSSIQEERVNRRLVSVPSGVKIMSLQDMMMQGFGAQ